MVQVQGQKQNVKVVINLADQKKKKKRRKRIRKAPPQGKSSFQDILQANQAPQVIVRRIYDQSPYLDELNRARTAPAPVIQNIPLTSQADRRTSIADRLSGVLSAKRGAIMNSRGIQDVNTQAVAVRTGERMSMPTTPETSQLQGAPEPPPIDEPVVKRRGRPVGSTNKAPRSDKGKKRDKNAPLLPAFENAFQALKEAGNDSGYETEGGFRGFTVYKSGRQVRGVGGAMSDVEREQMRAGVLRKHAPLDMLTAGTNTAGQV